MSIFRSDEKLYDSKESCDRHEWFRIYGFIGTACIIVAIIFGMVISECQCVSETSFTVLTCLSLAGIVFMLLAVRKLHQEYLAQK